MNICETPRYGDARNCILIMGWRRDANQGSRFGSVDNRWRSAVSFSGAEQGRPEILIVGTFHMANRGHDAYNVQTDDVLSPKRQQEIENFSPCFEVARFGGPATTPALIYWETII